MMMFKKIKKGFTLVELSIVLIIIGVLVAGIISGREIIRQAEFRSVITDYERFVTSYNTFVGLYGKVPGDISVITAQNLLGITDINGGGNADDKITYFRGGIGFDEINAAWEHLSKGGIIPGEYEGTPGLVPTTSNNLAPLSKVQGALYAILHNIDGQPSSDFDIPYENGLKADAVYFFVVSSLNDANDFTSNDSAIMSVIGASFLDRKLDDNNPTSGRVRAGGPNCVDATVQDAEVYDFDNNGSCFVGIEF